ncbi:MAG TPA: hypothetical protein VFU21_10235 [Kofleriaceae bacterium]|nr:hypothetical protein [Kofleriaceae bacterium]
MKSVAVAVLGIGIGIGIADARKEEPPPGELAWIRDGAIWRAPLAAPDQPAKLADLAVAPALIRGLSAARDGSALLVDLGANAAWIDLAGGKAGAPVFLPCAGGRLARGGGQVLCGARRGKGSVAYRMRPTLGSAALEALDPERTAFTAGDRLVSEVDGALRDQDRTVVAPHAPVDRLMVSPDGARAVGRYQDGDGDALFGFRLDGRAARRKLITGTPVAWSADSVWLAVDGEDAACVLRAVGGEYKCWDHFRALALSADGSLALLGKPPEAGAGLDIYQVATTGVRRARPRMVVERALAATLLP